MRKFPPDEGPYFIAEVGGNHGGEVDVAKEYLTAASDAGVDAVKFQLYSAENLIVKTEPTLPLAGDEYDSQFERFKELELTDDEWLELVKMAEELEVDFAASVFDREMADFVAGISPFIKIASGDLTNIPLLRYVNSLGKPVVISTGFATIEEIRRAVRELSDSDLTLLHCIGSYPTPDEQAHLQIIDLLNDEFETRIGYSDHTIGTLVPLAAVARGARVIEKHFTLDKTIKVGDHRLSANPSEMATIVEKGQQISSLSGDWARESYLQVEEEIRTKMRRSLASKQRIHEGEIIEEDMLTTLRPATGIEPTRIDEIIGERILKDVGAGEILTENHIKIT